MATPEKPPGPVPAGGLNPVIAATFAQIVGPRRRHSQDAPGGVPVACRTPVKSPEMTPPAHLSHMITRNAPEDTAGVITPVRQAYLKNSEPLTIFTLQYR